MNVSGATFVRNAIKFDYPVRESITSVLPLCDEFIVNVGDSEDETLRLIESIPDRRISIIRSTWDDTKRSGGRILSEQTDIALSKCKGDWIFYIQADEVLHERYLETVKTRMKEFLGIQDVEGLLFDFKHFYGSYFLIKNRRDWYRREIRVIRNGIGVTSWKDAQGFRLNGRKLRVVHSQSGIYHYGWARNPAIMLAKQRNLDRYWHDDSWIEDKYKQGMNLEAKGLIPFTQTHPSVMRERVQGAAWDAYREPERLRELTPGRLRRILSVFDRIGEYRNYVLLNDRRLPNKRISMD